MRFPLIIILSGFTSFFSLSQHHQEQFNSAYSHLFYVPRGTLEAVSFTNTRMVEIKSEDINSCSGLPQPYGIMGVFDNGKNYFLENGKLIGKLSGISISQQKGSVEMQIMAYGLALDSVMKLSLNKGLKIEERLRIALLELSEIPKLGAVNDFARNSFAIEVFRRLNEAPFATLHHFDVKNYDLESLFGKANYSVLTAPKIEVKKNVVFSKIGVGYTSMANKSQEYGPAIWTPTPSCNFSSRSGTAVSAITIHTVQGSYAGAISWAQNCNSGVSYHYVIRSSDGQVTQMVLEGSKAWHVGSENPYTIGYEHEGYVNNPVWYTNALYQASANLTKDIILSGYGINGLRTYYGAASSGSNSLGTCVKIKGHQHYPNQTHTDPGINWDWEKYYRLINSSPTITTITNTSGNFYDSGGSNGNYSNDERSLWLIQPANSTSVTLSFTAFSVHSTDKLFVYNGSTINAPLLGSYSGTTLPTALTGTSGSLLVEFRSDCGSTSSGWAAGYTSIINTVDNTPPTSTISNGPTWQVADFQAQINDVDAGSGVDKGFYLVADRNPANVGWMANGSFGFAHEDFQDVNVNWTLQTGLFSINNQAFLMNDASQNNSNAYLNVTQNNSAQYLYEWEQKITSSNLNQRAGMHFFCSDPTLPNRGNSYFVYLREETDKIQLYKVTNDVFTVVNEDSLVITPQVNYAIKTWYNPTTGIIKVYVNNQLISQWQDANPIISGNSISLRSGACTVRFDNVKVFKSRSTNISVTIGNNQQMRFQSNSAITTGLIQSEVIDNNQNWSATTQKQYLIDWTPPVISSCNDGTASDIDTVYTNTLSFNWNASDIHSSISNYTWALGTTIGGTNIIAWTNSGLNTAIQHLLANPFYGQTYYFSVKAQNGALLNSQLNSDGQKLLQNSTAGQIENELASIIIYPNPSDGNGFWISNLTQKASVLIYDINGKLIHNTTLEHSGLIETPNLAIGNYNVIINSQNKLIIKRLIVQ
jgi:N-acetyl-anhydromuramyl-L-alanine amidase AmpD